MELSIGIKPVLFYTLQLSRSENSQRDMPFHCQKIGEKHFYSIQAGVLLHISYTKVAKKSFVLAYDGSEIRLDITKWILIVLVHTVNISK